MRSFPPCVILWRGRSAPPLSERRGNRPLEPADVALGPEAIRAVEHAEQDGREMTADAGDGAQDIFGLQLGVERLDPAVQVGAGGHVGGHDVDLDGDFPLQLGVVPQARLRRDVDMVPVEFAGLAGGLAQTLDEGVDEGPAVGMVAAGVAGDEAGDGGPACLEDRLGVDPTLQQGHGEAGAEIGQDALQRRGGPADQVEKPALGRGDRILEAAALPGEALQGVAPGRRDVERVERRPAEARNGGQHMRIREIGLGPCSER